ncbi:MAG TPA: replication factor C small subunit [Nitrososphaeraceae archaeon]
MSTLNNSLRNTMWVEKYRPQDLEQIVNQNEIVDGISNLLKNPEAIPHLLFAGPPGVGKTTAALCIARRLLGEDWRKDTLELNASDERGIKMVRERVKSFAAVIKLVTDSSNEHKMYRLIILDEADEMTPEAQTALRRIIEDSSKTTRFLIICNYLSQIIDPLQSRCVIFRFTRLTEKDVVDHMKIICKNEETSFEEKALAKIYEITSGDLRLSINILQASAATKHVSISTVHSAMGMSGKARVSEIIRLAISGKFNESRIKLMELTTVFGISHGDFLKYAYQEIYSLKLPNPNKIAVLMAEYDFRLATGAHPDLQLTAFLAQLALQASDQQ